ncbi:MAG: hypothetical protein R3311_02270 [Oceanisphaera sp.]|nr:hypothetical protein [Oceanisphaera sp.]
MMMAIEANYDGKTGIVDRHHQLRTRNPGYFRIDPGGSDAEILTGWHQITDFPQKCLVGCHIPGLLPLLAIPVIEPGLDFVPPLQQGPVDWAQLVNQGIEAGPEMFFVHSGTRQYLVLNQLVEARCDLQTTFAHSVVAHNRHSM